MKTVERIPILANVLNAVCKRPSVEVGKLVKAVVKYVNEGTVEPTGSERLDAYLELIVIDLEMQQKSADEKSRKCSESARCRTAKSGSTSANAARKANVANAASARKETDADDAADGGCYGNEAHDNDARDEGTDETQGILATSESMESADDEVNGSPVIPSERSDFNANDATSSFEQMKTAWANTGNNENDALNVWKRLTPDQRMEAFAYALRTDPDVKRRTYLFVLLRDRLWTKNIFKK